MLTMDKYYLFICYQHCMIMLTTSSGYFNLLFNWFHQTLWYLHAPYYRLQLLLRSDHTFNIQYIKLLTVDYVSNINFCYHFALCSKILYQWTFKIICEWLYFLIMITLILSTILLLLRPEFAFWNWFPAILLMIYSHTINYRVFLFSLFWEIPRYTWI